MTAKIDVLRVLKQVSMGQFFGSVEQPLKNFPRQIVFWQAYFGDEIDESYIEHYLWAPDDDLGIITKAAIIARHPGIIPNHRDIEKCRFTKIHNKEDINRLYKSGKKRLPGREHYQSY